MTPWGQGEVILRPQERLCCEIEAGSHRAWKAPSPAQQPCLSLTKCNCNDFSSPSSPAFLILLAFFLLSHLTQLKPKANPGKAVISYYLCIFAMPGKDLSWTAVPGSGHCKPQPASKRIINSKPWDMPAPCLEGRHQM